MPALLKFKSKVSQRGEKKKKKRIFRQLATCKGEICQQFRELDKNSMMDIIKCSTPVLKE